MLSGISIWQLLIILAIVIMIFGTKKLRNLGGDLGGAIKNFKSAMNTDKADSDSTTPPAKPLEHQQGEKQDADFSRTQERDKH